MSAPLGGGGKPPLTLVAAVAANGVIGRDNQLLWHIPEDMAHFRTLTRGCPVIMGRKTWDSLPERFRPLPGRRNLVLTRQAQWQAPGAEVVRSLSEALARAAQTSPSGDTPAQICVIGGAELYAQALPFADVLELTEVHQAFDGDAHFPTWPRQDFREARRESLISTGPEALRLDFVRYERQPANGTPRP